MSDKVTRGASGGGGQVGRRAPTFGPGAGHLPVVGIILVALYIVLGFCALLWGLVLSWPDQAAPGPASSATRLRYPLPLQSCDVRLFMFVVLSGALGSMVHVVRSFYWYVGNRDLRWSWLPKYLLQPVVGAALAAIFYFVLRGGLLQQSENEDGKLAVNPFGFAGLAALAGLFSEQAVEKLRQVFATLLASAPVGSDHVSPAAEDTIDQPPEATESEGTAGSRRS